MNDKPMTATQVRESWAKVGGDQLAELSDFYLIPLTNRMEKLLMNDIDVKRRRAEASKKFRDSKIGSGLKEIRNCYIKPEHEQSLRNYANQLNQGDL
jgi:hypothetical protein